MTARRAPGPASPLVGAMLAGALLVPLVTIAIAAALAGPGATPPFLRVLFTRALSPSGWIGLPLLGAGLGALASLGLAGGATRIVRVLALAVTLAVLGAALIARPAAVMSGRGLPPQSPGAKGRAILRAAFRSPAAIRDILHFTRDPDPVVREQAVLALGVNLVVSGIERAPADQPSAFASHPLRDSLAARLTAALDDPVEAVRAEAARALWKAPRAFGSRPAAAETLAAILDRSPGPQGSERLAWLALDAAAGAPYPPLKRAAARFAAATPDSELARAARQAAR